MSAHCPPSAVRKEFGEMENFVVAASLILLIGGAVSYLVKAKKRGVKCVGCPAGGSCRGGCREKGRTQTGPAIARKTIRISGMHCDHCAQSVEDRLNQIEGVSASVDYKKGCASVSLDRMVEESTLIHAVEEEGFTVDSVRA